MPHPECRVKISDTTGEMGGRESLQVGVEPGQGALDYIATMLGAGEHVALVFVDDELGFDAQCFEGVPEFVGLRSGNFAVAVADEDERGGFGFFDEVDGRTL